jgi:hypothetical protein
MQKCGFVRGVALHNFGGLLHDLGGEGRNNVGDDLNPL